MPLAVLNRFALRAARDGCYEDHMDKRHPDLESHALDQVRRYIAHDDDAEAARRNAAAIGRRAGMVGLEADIYNEEGGPFHAFFTGRGKARAAGVHAVGDRDQAQLASTVGAMVEADTNLAEQDDLLKNEAARAEQEAAELRDGADKAEDERSRLSFLERGHFGLPYEVTTTGILGLADVALFGNFLEQRGALAPKIAWATAALLGLALAAAGSALGRVILARAESHLERRRGLTGLLAALALTGAWFLIEMTITRHTGNHSGDVATITFGAPLSALTVIATGMVSFVTEAGSNGRALHERAQMLRSTAVARELNAITAANRRERLRDEVAAARGAHAAADASQPFVALSTDHRAEAQVAEGEALWGLARTFANLYPAHEQLDTQVMTAVASRRILTAALAALGACAGALLAHLAHAPFEVLALVSALAAGIGAFAPSRVERTETTRTLMGIEYPPAVVTPNGDQPTPTQ
jgi:hypothetical protein